MRDAFYRSLVQILLLEVKVNLLAYRLKRLKHFPEEKHAGANS